MLLHKLLKNKKALLMIEWKKTYTKHNFKSKAVIINKCFWTKNKLKQTLLNRLAC